VKLVPDERGGVSMTIDRPAEGDAVVDGGKRPLLIVDAALNDDLDGVVLDLSRGEKEDEQPQFVFRREPATSWPSCAAGHHPPPFTTPGRLRLERSA
jgi:hypothetical protein